MSEKGKHQDPYRHIYLFTTIIMAPKLPPKPAKKAAKKEKVEGEKAEKVVKAKPVLKDIVSTV